MKLSDFHRADLVKLGIAGGAILIALVLLVLNWNNLFGRPQSNMVVFFQIKREYGTDFRRPIGPDNPVNSTSIHNTITYKFANSDGQLFIIQHPANPTMAPQIIYRTDARGARSPAWVVRLRRIGDPCKEALTMAAMRGRWMIHHWLRIAGASRELVTQADDVVATGDANRALLMQSESQGLFAPGSLKRIQAHLVEFLKAPGNPLKDAKRQALAHQIMAEGRSFTRRWNAHRDAIVAHEVDGIDELLSSQQKTRIAQAMTRFLSRFK